MTNFNVNCGNPEMSAAVRQTIFGTDPTAGGGLNTPAGVAAQCATIPNAVAGFDTNNHITPNADPNLTTRLVGTSLRLTQDGPRISINEHEAYQLVIGARGGLGFGWNYDVSAQYGHTTATTVLENDALKGNFQNGLLVTFNGAGVPTCTQDSANCSPLNFFTSQGLTAANVNYIRENLDLIQDVDQWDVQGTVTGDLGFAGIQSPLAKEPVGMALGVEYRQEEARALPDHNLATGNLVGFQSAAPTAGGFDVGEGYIEVRVPLIEDVPAIESLSFNGAYRYDHYNTTGDANSYNLGLEYQPIDDIRFRGGFQRAVRAPNVSELFTPAGGSSANSGRDPCSQNSPLADPVAHALPANVAALCVATGVPSAAVGTVGLNCPTNQCQAATGGNPFLKPETSDSLTLGIVATPTFIPGFTATVDYYNIKIGGFITATPISSILNNCYNPAVNTTMSASAVACSFVHRDALGTIATQNLGFVVSAEGNIGGDKVQGIDTELNYDLDLNDMGWSKAGSLSFNFVGTLVTVNNTTLADGTVLHCAGVYGPNCGEPQNRFRSNFRVTWADDKGDFSVSLRWRYLSSIQFEGNLPATDAPGFGFVNNPTLGWGAKNYFDLSGTWSVTDAIDLRAGVRNILGQDPPLTDNNTAPASDINNNTFPNTYDALGRVIFVGATVKL